MDSENQWIPIVTVLLLTPACVNSTGDSFNNRTPETCELLMVVYSDLPLPRSTGQDRGELTRETVIAAVRGPALSMGA